ncbi:MAG: hypothetical protein M1438_13540 [Deltaproteobacteria bacterium]|nr:hypothetical protein [Deltaproteobacteria bacterium]
MLPAILSISIYWLFLTAVFCGIGLFSAKFFALDESNGDFFFSIFWLGWSSTLIILQIWHLVARVTIFCLLSLVIIGVLGIIINIWVGRLRKSFLYDIKYLWLILFLLLPFLSRSALEPITNYDSGLYHLPTIKWICSYPIIPGLGNLHGRLAFNSSYFLYVALLNNGYWVHKSHHLANGLLFLVIFLHIFIKSKDIIFKKVDIEVADIIGVLFLIPLSFLAIFSCSSPSPDIPIFLLGFVAITYFAKVIYAGDGRQITANALLVVLICGIAITIKANFLFLGLPMILIVLAKLILQPSSVKENINYKKVILLIPSLIIIILAPWLIRNIILSGYLVYPSTWVSFNVDWRMPAEQVIQEQLWIKSWARLPLLPPEQVLNNWHWFFPWLKRMVSGRFPLILTICPILLGIIALPILLRRNKFQDERLSNLLSYITFILPSIISIICWFVTAPEPRFSGASFWYFGAGTMAVACQRLQPYKCKKLIHLYLLISLTFILLLSFYYFLLPKKKRGTSSSVEGYYLIPKIELRTFVTRSGLQVYVPKDGDRCWDAPLPCTPYPNGNLSLRESGNISKGFKILKK